MVPAYCGKHHKPPYRVIVTYSTSVDAQETACHGNPPVHRPLQNVGLQAWIQPIKWFTPGQRCSTSCIKRPAAAPPCSRRGNSVANTTQPPAPGLLPEATPHAVPPSLEVLEQKVLERTHRVVVQLHVLNGGLVIIVYPDAGHLLLGVCRNGMPKGWTKSCVRVSPGAR